MIRRGGWLAPLLLAACAATAPVDRAPIATPSFVLVRDAASLVDARADPPLSAAGVGRARVLARRLADAPLVAVYATPFRRARGTAQPAALLHGLATTTYDPTMPAPALAAMLRASHRRGMVLVVGDGAAVAAIASALCACTGAMAATQDADVIDTVRMQDDGRGVLARGRQTR